MTTSGSLNGLSLLNLAASVLMMVVLVMLTFRHMRSNGSPSLYLADQQAHQHFFDIKSQRIHRPQLYRRYKRRSEPHIYQTDADNLQSEHAGSPPSEHTKSR